jgi:hypothetical protein
MPETGPHRLIVIAMSPWRSPESSSIPMRIMPIASTVLARSSSPTRSRAAGGRRRRGPRDTGRANPHSVRWTRYTEDALDLCDALSSFSARDRASLNELARVMGLSGKPDGMHGGEVERFFREGRIDEIARYCVSDVVNTYQLWLRYELFRGRLSVGEYEASECVIANLVGQRPGCE